MDRNWLDSKLNSIAPHSILEVRKFGRSEFFSAWVELQAIQKVARALRDDPDLSLDWLENLSFVEFESVLVASYFVRSFSSPHQIVLRASAIPSDHKLKGVFLFHSIREIWPMAEPMEKDAEEMFGIRFIEKGQKESKKSEKEWASGNLPQDWKGYPLRKNYRFPREVYGIPHSSFGTATSSESKIRSPSLPLSSGSSNSSQNKVSLPKELKENPLR